MAGSLVRAVYDFETSLPGELSFHKGDVITVSRQIDNGWYEGTFQSRKGVFPVSYTEKLDLTACRVVIAKQDFVSNGGSELSFFKGDLVRVISEVDSHWLQGELSGQVGILPLLYVKDWDAPEYDQVTEELSHALEENLPCAQAMYDFEARHDGELSFPKDSIIILSRDVDEDWFEGSFNGNSGYFPKNYVKVLIPFPDVYSGSAMPCARAIYPFVGENESELTFKEGDLILLRKRAGSQWMEGELDGYIGLFPASFVDIEIDLKEEIPPLDEISTESIHSKHGVANVVVKQTEWKAGDKARALYHFSAMHQGDIELNEGDLLDIVRVVDDNWAMAKFQGGVSGMCPLAYLEPFDAEHIAGKGWTSSSSSLHTCTRSTHYHENVTENVPDWASTVGHAIHNSHHNDLKSKHDSQMQNKIRRTALDSSFDEDSTSVLQPTSVGEFESNVRSASSTQYELHQRPSNSSNPFSSNVSASHSSISAQEQTSTLPKSPSAIYAQPFKKSSKYSPVRFSATGSGDPKEKQRTESSHFVFDSVSLERRSSYRERQSSRENLKSDVEPLYAEISYSKSWLENLGKNSDESWSTISSKESSESSSVLSQLQISRMSGLCSPNQHDTVARATVVSTCTLNQNSANVYALSNKKKPPTVERFLPSKYPPSSSSSSTELSADSMFERPSSQRPSPRPAVVQYLGSNYTTSSDYNKTTLLDDNLFNSPTSLSSPLLPLPAGGLSNLEGRGSGFCGSTGSSIVPKRQAPPVPNKPMNVRQRNKSAHPQIFSHTIEHKIQTSNRTMPRSGEREHQTDYAITSKGVTAQKLPSKQVKRQQTDFKSATLPRSMKPTSFAPPPRQKSLTSPGEDSLKSKMPNSLIDCNGDSGVNQRLRGFSPSQGLNVDAKNKKFVFGTLERNEELTDDSKAETKKDEIDLTEIPQISKLDDKIAEAEKKLQREKNICTGMEIIMQMIGADSEKQKEMDPRMSASKLKIKGWLDELSSLKEERQFLIDSHVKRKELQQRIAEVELELEKQVNSQKSLEALLGVVEDSRKQEVLDNLGVCADIIEEISTDLKQLEESLHGLDYKPPSTQQQLAEQRQKVVNELISTEKAYLQDLQLCVKYFFHELKKSEDNGIDCDVLFGNMEEVVELSAKLFASFEEAVDEKDSSEQELGKCFVAVSEKMKRVYADYCKNHDDATALMEKYEEDVDVQNAFRTCMEAMREHTKCWDLSSFLIKPVQRVLKYPLLLNELLKCTPEIHKDKYNLIRAINAMTDVAAAINEVKRRKDLVVKYKRPEESGISKKVQKLNWHSVIKKSSRINQKLTQLTGLGSQTVDETFIEEEKKLYTMEKLVKNLTKNIGSFLEQNQETTSSQLGMAESIKDYYSDAATCTEVSLYGSAQRRIMDTRGDVFMNQIQSQVLTPLNLLLSLFQGPQRLIQKRHHKCLDYDSLSNKIDKIKDRDKFKTAKEELELAKKTYEALNTQLLEDLPRFRKMAAHLIKRSLLRLAISHRNFLAEILAEYNLLMEVPVIQNHEGDIVEQHTKRLATVVEKFASISFIPCSFVAKDTSKKKRRSMIQPPFPSSEPQTEEREVEAVDTRPLAQDGRTGSLRKKRPAPTPPARPTPVLPPQPKPRRKISDTNNQSLSGIGKPELVEVTPAEESRQYLVQFTFEAQNTGELGLRKGDHVTVLRHSDTSGNPEWWLVECCGTRGYVPGSFLTLLDPGEEPKIESKGEQESKTVVQNESGLEPSTLNKEGPEPSPMNEGDVLLQYFAEWSFESTCPSELSLEEGQVVIVRCQRDLEGNPEWWLVEAGGSKGYVPASFLSPITND